MSKTRHVPKWVRRMKSGCLRSYLIGVFLPRTKKDWMDSQW